MSELQAKQIELLRSALKQVEFVMTYVNDSNVYPKCPWCGGDKLFGHRKECVRQIALTETKETAEEIS